MKILLVMINFVFVCFACAMEQQGQFPLHDAATRGDLVAIKDMVENGGVDINAPTAHGLCALHCAVQAGHTAIVRYLLCHGAISTASTDKGVRPVHLAAEKGYVEILRSLIQYPNKANKMENPDVQDKRGYTPMHYAAKKGHLDAVQYLHAWGARIDSGADHDVTPLALAKEGHHDHVVHYLTLTSKTGGKSLRARY